MAYDYELFVIGGGSGGVRAGNRTAALGHKVGVAEESRYGGTCVVRGCVPKKLYVYASTFHEHFEDAAGFGWSVGDVKFDWPTLVANKEAEITRLEGLYKKGLNSNKVDVFDSRAELRGPHEIWLSSEDRVVTAERILIAVGGTPNRHTSLEGHELGIISDDAFDLEELPKSVLIEGAGYIAVEFAGIFSGLGVDTTIIYRGPEILRGFDDDLRELLPRFLGAVSRREIIARMLRNLKAIYAQKSRYDRALQASNKLCFIQPYEPQELRDRGQLYEALECFSLAIADFEHYLEVEPDADDHGEIVARVEKLRSRATRLN